MFNRQAIATLLCGIAHEPLINEPFMPICWQVPFCERNLNYKATLHESSYYYALDAESVVIDDQSAYIYARLNLQNADMAQGFSSELDSTMWFYQNGIVRVLLEEPATGRFRISGEKLPVVDRQLVPISGLTAHVLLEANQMDVSGLMHDDGSETFSY